MSSSVRKSIGSYCCSQPRDISEDFTMDMTLTYKIHSDAGRQSVRSVKNMEIIHQEDMKNIQEIETEHRSRSRLVSVD